jgi:pimeloyl-ACP methyl ester carboxylesterase
VNQVSSTGGRLRSVRVAALALAAAAAILLSACTPAAPISANESSQGVAPELLPFYTQKLKWTGCDGGFECATATAPVDWAHPSAGSINLALIRHRAPGTKRRGSLFVNPGGPGASGVNFVRNSLDYAVDKKLQASFDIVGFDPRGIGGSTPIKCFDAAGMDEYLYGLPTTRRGSPENLKERIAAATDFARACQKNSGALLAHVDSISTARDLDMLRATVGDKTLSYLGYSYGTFIGAMYAQTFPTKVGHLVLDGAVDPTQGSASSMVAQAVGFEMALSNYLTWCFTTSDCPFEHSIDSARAKISQLLDQVDAFPIANADGRSLGADTMVTAIIAPLYSKDSWKYLTEMFVDVMNRQSAAVAFELADWYNDRSSDGTYSTNQNEAFSAVSCLDSPSSQQSAWASEATQLEKKAPLIGKYFTYSEVGCSVWPVKPVLTPAPLRPTGDRPIVVVGTTGDPATPIAWADSLAKQLTNGRLVRFTGEGHTGYNRGSDCVNKIVDDYLLGSAEPAALSQC